MAINIKLQEKIRTAIQDLKLKKLLKINENRNKIKIRRDLESEYSIYLNGAYISTLTDIEDSLNMTLTLLEA
jgi:hypothetical protein